MLNEGEESLYTVFWSGRPLTGMNGFLTLGLRGLGEDSAAMVISPAEYDAKKADLLARL